MPNTSEALIASLQQQPLLVVLRADQPCELVDQLSRLEALGIRHAEVAWSAHPAWVEQTASLVDRFPALHLGAASVVNDRALEAVVAAGLSFAVSPVLDPPLQHLARELGVTLVPGVFTPSEVHQACSIGCPVVKLFPASTVGPAYWRRLEGPLGDLPFCIAAGGLGPADLGEWLRAGVDAVAIGGALSGDQSWRQLAEWLSSVSG